MHLFEIYRVTVSAHGKSARRFSGCSNDNTSHREDVCGPWGPGIVCPNSTMDVNVTFMRCNIIQKIGHVIYLFGHWMTCIHKASSGKHSFYLEPKSRLALTNYDKESSSIISSLGYIACQNALEIVQRIYFTQRERKPGKFQGFWYKHDINTCTRRHAPKSITLKLRPSTFRSKM